MKNNQVAKTSLPETASTEKELDQVSAAGTKNTYQNETPKESISLNFSEIKFTYTSQ